MATNNGFNLRLLHAMQKAGLKQIELSEKTGISRAMISQYLSGAYKPKQTNVYKLATALGVSFEYLLGLKDTDSNSQESQIANAPLRKIARRIETEFSPEDAEAISEALDFLKRIKNNGNSKNS